MVISVEFLRTYNGFFLNITISKIKLIVPEDKYWECYPAFMIRDSDSKSVTEK